MLPVTIIITIHSHAVDCSITIQNILVPIIYNIFHKKLRLFTSPAHISKFLCGDKTLLCMSQWYRETANHRLWKLILTSKIRDLLFVVFNLLLIICVRRHKVEVIQCLHERYTSTQSYIYKSTCVCCFCCWFFYFTMMA